MSLERVNHLARSLGCVYAEAEPLSKHVTLRIGGAARFYVRPSDWKAAEVIILALWKSGEPFRILGGGTNLLIPEGDLPTAPCTSSAWAVRSGGLGRRSRRTQTCPCPSSAAESVRRGFAGLEGMGGVPGTVGGAVVMNAGAFGNDVAKVVAEVALIEKGRGLAWHPTADFTFEYRRTNLPEKGVVAGCRFTLAPGEPSALAARFEEAKARRNATQPWTQPTAGSVFKNPPGDYAGRILEELGVQRQTARGRGLLGHPREFPRQPRLRYFRGRVGALRGSQAPSCREGTPASRTRWRSGREDLCPGHAGRPALQGAPSTPLSAVTVKHRKRWLRWTLRTVLLSGSFRRRGRAGAGRLGTVALGQRLLGMRRIQVIGPHVAPRPEPALGTR